MEGIPLQQRRAKEEGKEEDYWQKGTKVQVTLAFHNIHPRSKQRSLAPVVKQRGEFES